MLQRTLPLPAALFALALTAACSKTTATTPKNQPACAVHADCGSGVCFEGACYPTATCRERKNCNNVPVCMGMRCICSDENRCLPVCVTDNECSTDGQCVNGVCTKYPVQFSAAPLVPSGKASLQVGLGQVELDFPMGVSMAGYASRRGPVTPYQDQLGGSNAWLDKPDVRAIAFDDGKNLLVILRLPLGWSTDELLADTALKVQQKRGINLVDHIVSTAPHSHSLPARFWHLAKGQGFGYFGYDEFDFEVFDRLTTSFADAVMMALDTMQPAKFGYTVVEDFDPMHKIHRDRRGEDDGFPQSWLQLDDRMFVLRVDDMNGSPIAVLTHFGMHGTIFGSDNPIITSDAPGGVEMTVTQEASKKYGHPVLGIYLQGNAGNISPGGDDLGHTDPERCQLIGRRTWAVVEPNLDKITTSASVPIDVVEQRIPISHEALGYKPNEFFDKNVMCDNSPGYFRYGAFQCVAVSHSDPSMPYTDGNLDCIFAVECLTDGYPLPQFQKTRIAVARIGDLAFATMPGEPVSEFGRSLSDRVRAKIPGINASFTLGYSMDHHFYLLDSKDWFQGGYEPSRDIWGWKMAPYFADKAEALAAELALPAEKRMIDNQNLKPMVWNDPAMLKMPVAPTESEGAPEDVLQDVPAQVERLDLVTFAWRGGHPGVDRPHVVLEVQNQDGSYTPVKRPGGLVYDDSGYNFMVHYDGQCTKDTCSQHAWRVVWEEQRDFPTGRYRLRADGKTWKSGAAASYTARSRTFEVVPSTKLDVYGLVLSGAQLEGRIVDRPAVVFTQDGNKMVADDNAGHLLRSPLVPGYLGAPLPDGMTLSVTGSIRRANMPSTPISGSVACAMVTEMRDHVTGYGADGKPQIQSAGPLPTSKFLVDAAAIAAGPVGSYLVKLTLTDPIGNSGTVTATITK